MNKIFASALLSAIVMFVTGCGSDVTTATISANRIASQANCEVNLRSFAQTEANGKQVTTKCDQDTEITMSSPVGDGWSTGRMTIDGLAQADVSCPTLEKTGSCIKKYERETKQAFINRESFAAAYRKENGDGIAQFK